MKEKGFDVSLRGLCNEIKERDERDANRAVSPLKPAEGALLLDSTELSVEAVFEKIIATMSEQDLL